MPCVAIALATGAFVNSLGAETTPTLSAPPAEDPAPLVFETEIVRTTEPLSLFNTIPPPLPLKEIQKIEPAGAAPKTTNPIAPATSLTLRWLRKPTPAVRRMAPPSGIWRVSRVRRTPKPSRVVPGTYGDTLVLVNGRELSCRILTEKAASLSVELSSGVTADFPKARVAKIVRRKPKR